MRPEWMGISFFYPAGTIISQRIDIGSIRRRVFRGLGIT